MTFDAMFGAVRAEFADPASYSELADHTFARKSDAPAGKQVTGPEARSIPNIFLSGRGNSVIRRASPVGP